MGSVYQPESWHDLYVMLGTSSAALIGLLFIVTSLHLDEIMNNPVIYFRARSNTLHLLSMLIVAILILAPQSVLILGVELVAIHLFGLRIPVGIVYNYYYKKKLVVAGGVSIYRSIPYFLAYSLGVLGGLALVEKLNWGMYLVTASYGILFVAIVMNAWGVMLGVGQTEAMTKEK
jgi:hypothetical protein